MMFNQEAKENNKYVIEINFKLSKYCELLI